MLQVMFVMAVQFVMAYHVRNLPWWKVLVVAYTVSGTCNQNLLSAQHEISHFLALKKPSWNKILAIASNCPIVVPVATKFRQYHQEHHSHLVCVVFTEAIPVFTNRFTHMCIVTAGFIFSCQQKNMAATLAYDSCHSDLQFKWQGNMDDNCALCHSFAV